MQAGTLPKNPSSSTSTFTNPLYLCLTRHMRPVLIVGAGPSGLVLALSLRKNGIPVRIIDKEPLPRLGERGAGIQPRSLELHHILGTISDVLSSGKPVNNFHLRVHDLLDNQKPPKISPLPYVEPQIHTPYSNPIMLGQQHHEKILRSHLEKMGTVVEFGSELKGFEQSEDHVAVQIVRRSHGEESLEETQVPWVVGTDGAHSTVRKTLALSFLGETREGDEMVVGDIKVKAGLDREFWERWVGPSNMVMLRPSSQDEDVYNFILAGSNIDYDKIPTSTEAFTKVFYSLTMRTDILFGDIIWVSKYRPNIRMVDALRVGRVFIAGDAAHCHTPAGGQGMNSSIQDSFNLGWKLSLVYKGYASAALLDSYQEERLPIIAEMLGKTTELFKQLIEKRGDVSQVRRSTELTQLGVNYRGSSIIGEDDIRGTSTTVKVSGYNTVSETAACPGDRAPEVPSLICATGEHIHETLFSIFSPSHHSILVFAKKYEEYLAVGLSSVINRLPENTVRSVLILQSESNVNEFAAVYDEVFVDSHAYSVYDLPSEQSYFVIVRPDGVVGARVHEVDGVERYFQKILS